MKKRLTTYVLIKVFIFALFACLIYPQNLVKNGNFLSHNCTAVLNLTQIISYTCLGGVGITNWTLQINNGLAGVLGSFEMKTKNWGMYLASIPDNAPC
jgi:hypothetical protein